MTPRAALFAVLLLASVVSAAQQRTSGALDDLKRSFLAPPPDSRIMMRWWWFGPAVTETQLERELRRMKEGGIGGVEVQPVYPVSLDDPDRGVRNLRYLSDDFISALRFAADKARELGLRMDLTLGSGWPYGGPSVGIDDAAGKLRIERVAVAASAQRVAVPAIGAGEQFVAAFSGHVDLGGVIDGAVRLQVGHPAGEVQFFIASRSGMMVKRAAVGAEGFVLNHYDRGAVDSYLTNVGDRLLRAFGEHPPFAIFCDSLEVYDSDWTPDFLEQFRARRGYDLKPHLPALAGDAEPGAAAIRHDWGETLTELLNQRFVEPMQEWARRHRTKFRMQAYGIPPATLSTNSRIDLPEGEGVQWRALSSTRWASSASHVYDRPITSSETWTWLHSPSFRATPLDVKAEADLHFLQGVNQLVGHGWPYTAEGVEYPGWRFYAAGVFNDKNPWWTVMPDLSLYLQRISFLMRQGAPVSDVAIYLPTDDAWAHFTPGHVSTIETLRERLGTNVVSGVLEAGFGFDFVDDEALRVKSGSYRAIVLPAVERLPIATLQRLEQFAERGRLVIATRRIPDLATGFRSTEADHAVVRAGAERLFRATGAKGRLADDERTQLGAELKRFMKPDVELSPSSPDFGFVHRHTDAGEIYFLANTGNRPLHAAARVRLGQIGAEWWDPISGGVSLAVGRTIVGQGTTFDLELEPYGSRVLVLSAQAQPKTPARATAAAAAANVDISAGWKVTFGTARAPIVMDTLRSWTDDDATRFFSGIASYEREISIPARMLAARSRIQLDLGEGKPIPPERLTNGMRAWFDPPVREAATIFVNGRRAGSLWAPPYIVAVTDFLHVGANTIRIDVANLAINHMAGHALPDYRLLNLRYGVRFEPQDMDKVRPVPSGLTGPIRLVVTP